MKHKTILLTTVFLVINSLLIVSLKMNSANASAFTSQGSQNSQHEITLPLSTADPVNATPTIENGASISARSLKNYAADNPIWTQKNNGIDMSAANFRYANNEILADVCFTLPSKGEWIVGNANMQLGDMKLLLSSVYLLEFVETIENGNKRIVTYDRQTYTPELASEVVNDGITDYACQTISFFSPDTNVDLSKADLNSARMVVERIHIMSREGENQCDFAFDVIQSALDKTRSGIELDCKEQELTIKESPAELSESKVENLFDIELGYFAIKGEWIFP